jgi:thiamine biosynthesis lipoprotein
MVPGSVLAPDSMLRRARPLLGTYVEIAADGAACPDLDAAIDAAFAAIERVHRLMSFHDPASDVSRLNRDAATRAVAIDAWTFEVLGTALDLNRRSNGAFDVAVAPALQARGLLPRHAGSPDGADTRQADAIDLCARRRVRFREGGTRIDLGGIAKGFAVDRAVATLRSQGVESALVNAGGDLAAFGPQPRTIHIRDPRDPRHSLGAVAIRDEALASSGGRFDPVLAPDAAPPAVIDPRLRAPVSTILGATVRAPTCMLADALTKVVMIAGVAAAPLLDTFGASALMVRADGEVLCMPGWQASRAA